MEAVRSSPSVGFNEVLDKIVELKNVYEVNSSLMKKRDEEIEALRSELGTLREALASTQTEHDETKKSLKHEVNMKAKFKELYRESQKQLTMAKQMIEDNSAEISSMEDYILRMQELGALYENTGAGSSSSGGDEFDGGGNSEVLMSSSAAESKTALSPIPEEIIEEIPDYYDEW